jgi:hypothetical protein
MDKENQAPINKIRSNYDALANAYAREVAGELDHRPLERDLLQRFAKECERAYLRSWMWTRAFGALRE